MSGIKVISDDACGCSINPGIIPLQASEGEIIVRNKTGITNGNVIKKYIESGKTVYELDDLVINDPIVNFSNDAGTREVGETVATVIFSGEIQQGAFPIQSRSITPDPGGLDLTAPFTFEKNNVTRNTAGNAEVHSLQATDDQGNQTIKTSQVPFKNAIYQGFNALATLTETEIKALVNKHLVDSVALQYGGLKTYVVPGAPAGSKYIYWVGPVGTPVITGAVLNGFLLPLTQLANVNVTNIHDGGIVVPYWVVRTANRLDPDTYQIALS